MASITEYQSNNSITSLDESYYRDFDFDPKLEIESELQHQENILKIRFEKQSFAKKRQELMKDPDLKGKFVAVIDGTIIDSDTDELALTKRVYEKHGYIPVLIEKIAEEKVVTIYSPSIEI